MFTNRREFCSASVATLLTAMTAAGVFSPAFSQSANVVLVTKDEVAQFKNDALETLSVPLSGDEPQIEVVRPVIKEGKVASPVAIEVRFKPATGKIIDSNSFKLYYGAFKIDVTDRLLKSARVTANGFSIDKVDIPAGSHRLVMRVSDDAGNLGLREIKFNVEA